MKIYSVTILEPGNKVTRFLWQSYQSATQSFGCHERKHGEGNVILEAVHVPEDAWQPVDRGVESKLNRVATLWEQLVQADQDGLDSLLDDLVKRLQPRAVEPRELPSVSSKAMEELDRLVDAR